MQSSSPTGNDAVVDELMSRFTVASAALHEEPSADEFIKRVTLIVKTMQEFCTSLAAHRANEGMTALLESSTTDVLDQTKALLIVAKAATEPNRAQPTGASATCWQGDRKAHSEHIKGALLQLVMSVKLALHRRTLQEPPAQRRPVLARQGSSTAASTQSLVLPATSAPPPQTSSAPGNSRNRGNSNSVFYVDSSSLSSLPSPNGTPAVAPGAANTAANPSSNSSSSSGGFFKSLARKTSMEAQPSVSAAASSSSSSSLASVSSSSSSSSSLSQVSSPPASPLPVDKPDKRGKTVRELVQELVPSGESTSESSSSVIDTFYVEDFLLTFRQFLSPAQLMDELVVRVVECANLRAQPAFSVKLRVVRVLKKWAEQFGEDFVDIPLLKKAFHLLDDLLTDEKLASATTQIRNSIRATLTEHSARSKAEEAAGVALTASAGSFLSSSSSASSSASGAARPKPAKQVIREISTRNDTLDLSAETHKLLSLSKDPSKFTQQMCLRDMRLFCEIQPRDFLAQYNGLSVPAIDSFIDWFNTVSHWVATTVCVASSLEERVGVIERWLELARQSLASSNYNFLMAIVSGLNMSPVQRLKRAWGEVSKKYTAVREEAEQILDPANNYKKYRTLLASRFADSMPLRLIPFIALYLKDFFFMNDGNPSLFGEGLVNYDKFELIASKIREIRRCQMSDFTGIAAVPEIQAALKDIQVYSEAKLYQLSLTCEPRSSGSSPADGGGGTLARKESEESAFGKIAKKLTLKKGDSKIITTML